MSQLTAEEKKAKLDEMLAKARAKKQGMEVEDYKAAERARREMGQKAQLEQRGKDEQQAPSPHPPRIARPAAHASRPTTTP